MTTSRVLVAGSSQLTLPPLFASDPDAAKRLVEFFTANIRNPNTRKAYASDRRQSGQLGVRAETFGQKRQRRRC